ncbi:transcriptional regulator TbsP [Haloplanus salilacus]|uniref:transcriptional regulator TbsP n=1 Tax=Haloplanus salilacus TaxID=2949994 RepID=UPI0030D03AD9
MVAGSNLHGGTFEVVLEAVFGSADDLLLVDPTAEAVEALTVVAATAETPPTVRVLAGEAPLKKVMDDFVVASNAADLIESGVLSVRTGTAGDGGSLLVTDGAVWSLVSVGDRVAALGDDDETFVSAVAETYDSKWEVASSFDLRTPPLSRVRETLGAEIGRKTRADFDDALDAVESAREANGEFDEVTLTLLVAAHNDVLLYDISKWGEDVGIASKATFSRTKTALEEEGLITTEKVPIDVGRPRLRLKLDDDRFDEASAAELAAVTLNHSA